MGEEKFASLSSGLLARKGAAKPAMRRQGFINPQGDVTEDLGWNDMGFETPKPIDEDLEYHGEAPLPEVRKQQDQLADGLGDVADPQNGHDAVDASNGHDAESDPVSAEDPSDQDEYEPYKHDGHGGLSPMETTEETVEFGEDGYEEEPEVVADMPLTAPEAVIKVPDQSLLAQKKSVTFEPKDEPKNEDVPAREKVAFTLRLDKERHLKLRLASAVTNQSAQRLVTEALDRFLEEHPDVQALTGQSSADKMH